MVEFFRSAPAWLIHQVAHHPQQTVGMIAIAVEVVAGIALLRCVAALRAKWRRERL
jgi:hypothetical protein